MKTPKTTFGIFLVILACFGSLPGTQAVVPPPDGGYPGGNTAEGQNALFSLSTGTWNTALGGQVLYSNTTGGSNTGTGFQSLFNNTNGNQNTGYGVQSLYSNTTGNSNTAIGSAALRSNDIGEENTAVGAQALRSNTTGFANTANGFQALYHNSEGNGNTAIGWSALWRNSAGSGNTATGGQALFNNTSGFDNMAYGGGALFSNTSGFSNIAVGLNSLGSNLIGASNIAIGTSALVSNRNGSSNVATGAGALLNNTIGSFNIAVGESAGINLSTGWYNIDIGNEGVFDDRRTIRVGTEGTQTRTFIAGIYNRNEGGTILPIYINSNGQLGTQPPASARRFKQEIKSMGSASEAILALKPVTFQYKNDAAGSRQFGLVAEDVADVSQDLVVRDENGEIYTVRYDAVNAMLLNEFLKEHRKNEEQGRDIQEQKATIALQQKQIDALTAGLQKVSAQLSAVSSSRGELEISKAIPNVVLNNP
jgi:trimeric autotransporter adhesin